MEILASVVSKIAEYTVVPVGRHVGYLFSYNRNFKELNDQVEELKIAREDIKNLVEVEKKKGNEILVAVKNWIGKADGVTDEVRQLCEDPRREMIGCTKYPFSNLWWRHQLSRKAKKVAKNVAIVQGEGKFGRDEIGYLPAIDGVSSTSATSSFVTFESRMSKTNEIMLALADPKLSILGVYGFGGVGKSTLVKQIAGKAKLDNLFEEVVMASVTRSPDLRRIQGEIADQLGLQFTEETVSGRAFRLRKRIAQGKNVLIILDDIWATIELEDVGIPYRGKVNLEERKLPDLGDQKGCKVLLISRSQNVLQQMETQKDFGLEVLSEKETRTLFEVMAGKNTEDRTYAGIAGEVARKCAGLPVLIVTVARALKNKDKHVWKDALSQLARVENKELHEIANSALELSYNQLESDEVKALFLLCGVEGPRVSAKDLLKYAMGLGIFKHIITVEDARNRLCRIISALKASCLLLEDETDVEFVNMHDVVHDVAISIASRDEYAFVGRPNSKLTEWPTEQDFLRSCSKIILKECNIQKLPGRLDCPELEFFHLFTDNIYSLEIPDSFFEGMKKLKVLDLTRMNISSLPASLCSLTKLETLCLDHCTLGDIAGIGALKNLKILSLFRSSMAELPSEIRQLSNMRMLDMSNSKIAVIPPNIISCLIALEELYMGGASIEWEDGNSTNQGKNASLAELRQLPNLNVLEVQIGEARNLPRDLYLDKLERFKILIGGVWKWTDNYGTSNTLKLKLSTGIHLEHRIRALIQKVESLWLEEINGISNVLYQLNGEGFPKLKHLHIQNNTQIQHIINSVGWNQSSFPILETLELQNLSKLEKLSHGLLSVNSLSKLKVIKVKSCRQLKHLFSDSMVKRLSQLNEIEVSECNFLQEIVLVENGSVGDNGITDTIEFRGLQSLTLQKLPKLDGFFSNESTKANEKRLATTSISNPFFKAKVAFPYLEALKLSSVNFHRIWDDDQLSATCGLQNLTSLIVVDCGNLKHLFSCSMIPSLSKLKQLEISKCHMMEEIIDPEVGRNNGFPSNEVQFSNLEKITITHMENLRTVWRCQFGGFKSLVIKNCAKLVCIFPSYMQKEFQSLETLNVTDCCSVEEIFKLVANEIGCEEDATSLTRLTLDHLPKLKQIWSMDHNRILNFPNLQAVCVEYCENLEYLFPLSIGTRLQKIEELYVKFCGNMKEIIANKEGQMEPTVRFVLDQLTSLRLWNLHQLRGFYAGNYTLSCPSLKEIYVLRCENLMLFTTQPRNNQEGHHYAQLQQPLFTVQEVIPNLEILALNYKYTTMILQDEFPALLFHKLKTLLVSDFEDDHDKFPDWFLRNVPSLEQLVVECSSFQEIFQEKIYSREREDERIQSSTRVKILNLLTLPKLQHICEEGFQIDPVLEVLEGLSVVSCPGLINLVPSSVTFSCLIILHVKQCNGLLKLITSATARSLVKLRTMKIEGCNLLEEIMSEKEGEAKDEIAFPSLETLKLVSLPRLNKFCSNKSRIKFPLLWKVVVRQCSRMEIFSRGNISTPNLREVQLSDEEQYWDGNLNGTIQKMFTDMVAFRSIEHLNLTQFPELKDLWYGPSMHNVFKSLKSLVVHNCDFLSDVLFTSNLLQVLQNLENLELKDCDSIEAVFDVRATDDKEVLGKRTTKMKKLTLSGLPKLKHIWSKDAQEIISFRNLRSVQVVGCKSLEYLFPLSLCQDLDHLEELEIWSCGVVEIVSKKEGYEECMFHFPRLTRMRLWLLPKLNSFYPGKHSLECPLLKDLDVFGCEALQIFDFHGSDFQQLHQVNKFDIPVQQALFAFEKVCTGLEKLALKSKDVVTIQNGKHQENLLDKIQELRLHSFYETPLTFPTDFLRRFPNLTKLGVYWSSFHTLFTREEVGHCQSGTSVQVEELELGNLGRLEYIWNEDSPSDTGAQLKSSEIDMMPSAISFKSLITLHVSYCKALFYLITSSIAKSLVQLRQMRITECEMEYAVKINEEVAEEEIKFENLEYLELNSLSNFRSFCSGKCTLIFPSLMALKIMGCPKMNIFSPGVVITPMLTTVEVENERKRLNGDLNTTIEQVFVNKDIRDVDSDDISKLEYDDIDVDSEDISEVESDDTDVDSKDIPGQCHKSAMHTSSPSKQPPFKL